MLNTLPIIVSVPHGGDIIAPEIIDQTLVSREDVFTDGDPLTRDIYDFRNEAAFYVETDIARACVDLNRAPQDLPPANHDGVVKTFTVTGKNIYAGDRVPRKKLLKHLLKKYHAPYHERLSKKSSKKYLFCGLDCHTMLDHAPFYNERCGKKRPFICLSNRGDRHGNQAKGRALTCPPEMIRSLACFLGEQFPEHRQDITLNDPFIGGYIVQRHSSRLPWIQIELNRSAYLDPRWFNARDLQVCPRRIRDLRIRFLAAIRSFVLFNRGKRSADQPFRQKSPFRSVEALQHAGYL